MKHTKSVKNIILISLFALLGILCLAYYGVCIAYAHAGVSWLWLWPLLALLCFAECLLLWKKPRIPKGLKVLARILAVLFLAVFAAVEGLIVSEMRTEAPEDLDAVIILGAALRGEEPTTPMRLRMETGLAYLRQNPNTLCVASGGQGAGESISEAACIAEFLIDNGISPDRILVEDRSADTEQNISNSFALIPSGAKVGLVSNSFHLFRAEYIARLRGYETCGVPAPTLLPLGIHYTVREFFAVAEIWMKSLLSSPAALPA